MVKSCKYFFEKNPILIISGRCEISDDYDIIICPNDNFGCKKKNGECCFKTNINKMMIKIWPKNENLIFRKDKSSKFVPSICGRIYKCEINKLYIRSNNINFDDFKTLVSTPTHMYFWNNNESNGKILDNNGKIVMFEKMVEAVPNLQYFQ